LIYYVWGHLRDHTCSPQSRWGILWCRGQDNVYPLDQQSDLNKFNVTISDPRDIGPEVPSLFQRGRQGNWRWLQQGEEEERRWFEQMSITQETETQLMMKPWRQISQILNRRMGGPCAFKEWCWEGDTRHTFETLLMCVEVTRKTLSLCGWKARRYV